MYEDDVSKFNGQAIFLPYDLRCASHTLSLVSTTDFSKSVENSSVNRLHNEAMGKCTTLWNMSRRPKSYTIYLVVHFIIYVERGGILCMTR